MTNIDKAALIEFLSDSLQDENGKVVHPHRLDEESIKDVIRVYVEEAVLEGTATITV